MSSGDEIMFNLAYVSANEKKSPSTDKFAIARKSSTYHTTWFDTRENIFNRWSATFMNFMLLIQWLNQILNSSPKP